MFLLLPAIESEVIVFNFLYITANTKFVINFHHKSAQLYPTTFRIMLGNASARVTSETTSELEIRDEKEDNQNIFLFLQEA